MIYIVIGVFLGIALAAGLSFLISSIILLKSNDFGNVQSSIEQYNGYDPIQVDSPDGNSSYNPHSIW